MWRPLHPEHTLVGTGHVASTEGGYAAMSGITRSDWRALGTWPPLRLGMLQCQVSHGQIGGHWARGLH